MKRTAIFAAIVVVLMSLSFISLGRSVAQSFSDATEECLECHSEIHPGIVASWRKSKHSGTTPLEAQKKDKLARRVSSTEIPGELAGVTVGCYECHGLRTDRHADSFEHNGYQINVIVSPDDCATCHIKEVEQYGKNMMSHAYGNLVNNSLYQNFTKAVNNNYHTVDNALTMGETDMLTEYESCLYCHGTNVEVKGLDVRVTDYGEFEFPVLEGWPNQGVGRINPDGSKGACTSCHSRHTFSIKMARKPYTCAECHKGPDVPAYKVYEVSKHGNIFKSFSSDFNFDSVPWVIGEDLTIPTCATCHASLLVNPNGNIVAERTHQYNDRLAWRLFGVPYAHPHPINASLEGVTNSSGLPLPVELDSSPVEEFVIDAVEQKKRNNAMQSVCSACHAKGWIDGHFQRLKNTIEQTNRITVTATNIMMKIWEHNFANGLPHGANPFDEHPERIWTTVWLFYANSTRFASAMAGGGDYGVFANGRYQTTEQLYQLESYFKLHNLLKNKDK